MIGAAILSFVLNEVLEGGVILFIIAVNAMISIVQEKKAEASLEALKNMAAGYAVALRQGEESNILAKELVPGDIVFLEVKKMFSNSIIVFSFLRFLSHRKCEEEASSHFL